MSREPERNDFSPWVGVVNQGPLVSSTNVFRLEHMLAARPSAVSSRQVTVEPGAVAPDFTLERTDGSAAAAQRLPRQAGSHPVHEGGDRKDPLTALHSRSGGPESDS